MTIAGHGLGSPRNGLPPGKFYVRNDPRRRAMVEAILADIAAAGDVQPIQVPKAPRGPRRRYGHGTEAGYRRHLRQNEKACPECTHAQTVGHARRAVERALRAAREEAPEEDPRCPDCGYLRTSRGHLTECGEEQAS